MLEAIFVLLVMIAVSAWMLLHHLEPERDSKRRIIHRVDEILPQTQCQQCGYNGCLPYASAIVERGAPIDRCPPGGLGVRRSLAELLGRGDGAQRRAADAQSLNQVVVIDEPVCIGCTKCIQACPVDAIVGAAKQMHTVLSAQCTGCELCIPPCPVDCIEVIDTKIGIDAWRWPRPMYHGHERRSVIGE
jgi:electron transport complex protein RnfB